MKFHMVVYITTLSTATIFRSAYTLPLGQKQQTTTMAHGYVINKQAYCYWVKRAQNNPSVLHIHSIYA